MLDERQLYLAIYLIGFLTFGVWETYFPFRDLKLPAARRWLNHMLLAAAGQFLALLLPIAAMTVAIEARSWHAGLFDRMPSTVAFTLAFLLLDLVHWVQHRCYHAFAALWKVHQVHHADADFDFTTALRFHPFEALLSQGTYLALIALTAPPPSAVLTVGLTAILLNFFEHANVQLPAGAERWARRILITPSLHRVHHSIEVAEQNENFGTIFSWWDRIFGTYAVEGGARTGLEDVSAEESANLVDILSMPIKMPRPARASQGISGSGR